MIVGVMRINDDCRELLPVTLGQLAAAVDRLVLLDHRSRQSETVAVIETVSQSRPCEVVEVSHYDHERTFEQGYAAAAAYSPDWILYPDHDELLPYEQLPAELAAARAADCWGVSFPFVNCWGDFATILDPRLNHTGHHAKAFRPITPTITLRGSGGFCVPAGWWEHLAACRYPLRHCHMMTPALRKRRLARGALEPWARAEPPTIPFRPGCTVEETEKLASR